MAVNSSWSDESPGGTCCGAADWDNIIFCKNWRILRSIKKKIQKYYIKIYFTDYKYIYL